MAAAADGALSNLEESLRDAIRHLARDELQAMWDGRWKAANHVEGALRLAKVAEALDVSRTTVWRMVQRGELKAMEIGGITHVSTDEISRMLRRKEREYASRRVR